MAAVPMNEPGWVAESVIRNTSLTFRLSASTRVMTSPLRSFTVIELPSIFSMVARSRIGGPPGRRTVHWRACSTGR